MSARRTTVSLRGSGRSAGAAKRTDELLCFAQVAIHVVGASELRGSDGDQTRLTTSGGYRGCLSGRDGSRAVDGGHGAPMRTLRRCGPRPSVVPPSEVGDWSGLTTRALAVRVCGEEQTFQTKAHAGPTPAGPVA